MDRPGFYVERKFFAGRGAQARAFAQFRATEFGREVEVQYVDFVTNKVSVIDVMAPQNEQQVA